MGEVFLAQSKSYISSKNQVAHMAPFLIFILASVLNAATSASLGNNTDPTLTITAQPGPSPSPTTTNSTGSVCHLPMVNCGCGSTGNSFDTKEQCEEVCSGDL